MAGRALPAFFQNAPGTVLDELADFELGGELEDEGLRVGDEGLGGDEQPLEDDPLLDEAVEGNEDDMLSQMISDSVSMSIAEFQQKPAALPETASGSNNIVHNRTDALPQAFIPDLNSARSIPLPFGSRSENAGTTDHSSLHFRPQTVSAPLPSSFPPNPPLVPFSAPMQQHMSSQQAQPMPHQQFIRQQQYQNQQSQLNQFHKPLPRGSMMNASDVRFVIGKSIQGLETVDAFNEDYYHIQLMLKKQRVAMETGAPISPHEMSYRPPLPMWADTRSRILGQMEDSKKALHEKTKLWEEKEQVLGHTQRSEASRPRTILSVPTVWDDDEDEVEDEEAAEPGNSSERSLRPLKQLFTSKSWSVRQSVQRAYNALGTFQELETLLVASPQLASNEAARTEVQFHIHKALLLLAQSLGIRLPAQIEVRDAVGNLMGMADVDCGYSLDGPLVGALLQSLKGKKLVARAFMLLTPEQRWVLVPVIVAKVLQIAPSAQSAEEASTEKILLKAVGDFVRQSKAHQLAVQAAFQADPRSAHLHSDKPAPAPFTTALLQHLRECLRSVMVAIMEKSLLRQSLLGCRPRAELLHTIVQVGDGLAEIATEVDWTTIRDTFMAKLDDE